MMEAYTHDEVSTWQQQVDVVELALAATTAGAWSVDLPDFETTWSTELPEVLGVDAAETAAVRERLLELIEPLTVAAQNCPVWHNFDLEQRHTTPGGETRWTRFLARAQGNAVTGKVHRLVGIAADVTERHGNAQALADLADRYRLLVEFSPDGICVHQDGDLVYVNPAAARFVAADEPSAVLGRPIIDFVNPRSVPELLQRVSSLRGPGEATEPTEVRLSRLDGGSMLIESVSVRTTWKGRPAYQVIMRDITAQKAAESALRYQAALVSHVSDAIIGTSSDGMVTSWNPAAERVYGHSEDVALGRSVGEVVGATLDPQAVVAQGGVIEAEHRKADGSALTVRVSASPMDTGYVLVCADETARRAAERRYRTVVAALDEGVVVLDANGLVGSANPAAGRILGLPVEAMIGCSPTLFPLHDESGARIPPSEYPSSLVRTTGMATQNRVVRARRPDGCWVWLSMSCRPLDSNATPPHQVVTSFTDITERKAIGERLEHDATHDPLTGLANRTLVLQRLSEALHRRRDGSLACVLFIDLDKFKVINDSLGHGIGDKVLRIAGQRLKNSVRRNDLVGRLGGDEFAVVTLGVEHGKQIRALIHHIRDALTEPITVDGRRLRVDASIGVVTAGEDDERSAEDLLRDADVAMYQAKTRGRGRHEFFDVELRERVQRQLRLEQDLRDSVRAGQLWVAYQPVVDLRTYQRVAVEGLLRWQHPVHGLISPGEFIPLAEESDLINLVGGHMLRTATRELARRRLRGDVRTRLTVNLSARQLEDDSVVDAVHDALRSTGLPPAELCLEITESALMRDPEAAADVLTALRGLGVRLAIDDFGTGYSSLAQLWKLPLDTLKIDRSFVMGLDGSDHADAEAIIKGIVTMAHSMGLPVIAEGTENERQVAILRGLGCDQAQGYHFGRPAPADEVFRS
ncbi:PAS domain S-box/diguanylate cyclase (GGDEF) domain-containing protein [Saccharomonospora azurea SZMC 14600]|uniref:sensor domain-containing protein n=1 Tax=Saccharomonospora azurea TaxID=40988 RepID=UPI00024007AE|nr:EAL domain-containing protein [Saccharomonospora azurea]EHK89244.1 PAS domain S-box/diguanylate cyclase (GGDEF) domain-containing protein [Saccharomonospora azurea SZMC 14600]